MAQAAFNYSHITTNTTTSTDARDGSVLHSLVVGGAGTTETITLYDNTTAAAPIIAVVTPTAAGQYLFDVALSNGLTIVTAGTTAGDYTVTWA